MGTNDHDVFDLFSDGSFSSSSPPRSWYPGAKIDLDDYGRILARVLPRGYANAAPAASIASQLGFPWENNQFPLRHLIRKLVLERGWPIATASVEGGMGLYLVDSETDIDLYAGYLDRRIDALTELRDTVAEGWERRKRSKGKGNDWPGQ